MELFFFRQLVNSHETECLDEFNYNESREFFDSSIIFNLRFLYDYN